MKTYSDNQNYQSTLTMTPDFFQNVSRVVDYLWEDEKRHFFETPRKDHIYKTLKKLRTALQKNPT